MTSGVTANAPLSCSPGIRVIIPGAHSVDGGSDVKKIRVFGQCPVPEQAESGGPDLPPDDNPFADSKGKPYKGWGPGVQDFPQCPELGQPPIEMDKPKKSSEKGKKPEVKGDADDRSRIRAASPSAEEQEDEWEEWAANPDSEAERDYPDGHWRNRTGRIG